MNPREHYAKLEHTLEAIKRDYAVYCAGLKARITEARSLGFPTQEIATLEAELKKAPEIYTPYIRGVEAELALVKKVLEAEATAEAVELERRAALEDVTLRSDLRAAWLEAGGSPAEFEAAYPQLKEAELTRRTLGIAQVSKHQAEYIASNYYSSL